MKLIKTSALIIILFGTLNLKPATVCGAFLDDGWGARPLGLGGAYTALGDDANSQLYNPAGIWQAEEFEAAFMYARLFTGLDKVDLGMNYASAVLPVSNWLNIGILWAGMMSASQYREDTFAVTGAMPMSDSIFSGINLKYLSHGYTLDARTLDDPVFESGSSKGAFSADIGAQWFVFEDEKQRVLLGLSAKNINRPDVGLKTQDIVPTEYRLGFAMTFFGRTSVSPSIDFSYRGQDWGNESDKMNVYAGCETGFFNRLLTVRAGINVNEMTTGLGYSPVLRGVMISVDYAFVAPLNIRESAGTHRVSLTMRFTTVPAE
ncbi:MAG: hypothetical protein ABII64_10375 [Elusimicrobiota bacterium]